MPVALRARRPDVRPLFGTQLDRQHPLARGLITAYLLNESAGTPRPLIPHSTSSTPAFTSAGWDAYGITVTSGGGRFDTGGLSGINTTTYPAGTFLWRQYFTGTATDATRYLFWGSNGFEAQRFTDNNWYVGLFPTVDTRLIVAATTANMPQNAWSTYAYVWTTGGQWFYRNGVQLVTSATPPSSGSSSASLWLLSANDGIGVSAPVGSRMDLMLFYSRALSVAELQWQFAEPYGMLIPPAVAYRPAGIAPLPIASKHPRQYIRL